ncbi:MAG: hypothetical protein KatS3mg062_0010 [Tepidiforma sp.]|nr:MAG: hypothetical protein KatS3mg062_0010 [Tepidiforma sp.]
MEPFTRQALSIREVAELLGCSTGHVWNLAQRGELPSFRLGKRLFIPREAVERLFGREEAEW